MLPLFYDGDYVLVSTVFWRIKEGDIVIVLHPQYGQLIKRVLSTNKQQKSLMLCSEHAQGLSTEAMGVLPLDAVRSKVLLKISR